MIFELDLIYRFQSVLIIASVASMRDYLHFYSLLVSIDYLARLEFFHFFPQLKASFIFHFGKVPHLARKSKEVCAISSRL